MAKGKKKKRVTLYEDPVKKALRENREAARRHNVHLIIAVSAGVAGLATLWFFAGRSPHKPEEEFTGALLHEGVVAVDQVLPPTAQAPRGRIAFRVDDRRVENQRAEAPVGEHQSAPKQGDHVHVWYRIGQQTKAILVVAWSPAPGAALGPIGSVKHTPGGPARPPARQ